LNSPNADNEHYVKCWGSGWSEDGGDFGHDGGRRLEVTAGVLFLLVPGLGHEQEQRDAGLAQVGEGRMPELVQVPSGARLAADAGVAVQQGAGLAVGQLGLFLGVVMGFSWA